MDTDVVLGRFRHERQILANLNHSNIVLLLDGGSTDDGLPYFVMDLVEGEPLHKYCDPKGLNLRDCLELFRQVYEAVDYAHQKRLFNATSSLQISCNNRARRNFWILESPNF
jgi:serine/threonine protein kinase